MARCFVVAIAWLTLTVYAGRVVGNVTLSPTILVEVAS